MAHQTLPMDPALVRWANMNATRFKYFRWTNRTARIAILYVGIIPGALGYLLYQTDGKYSLRNKLRGDTIADN